MISRAGQAVGTSPGVSLDRQNFVDSAARRRSQGFLLEFLDVIGTPEGGIYHAGFISHPFPALRL